MTNLRALYNKFCEMFPELSKEVGGYKGSKEAGTIFLLANVQGSARPVYKFRYVNDATWMLERI